MHEHVVLVHERELLARPRLGPGERVPDHPLDAVRRVDRHLGGDLGRRTDPQRAAVADVRALGALADDDEVDLARVRQRGADGRVDLRGAQVHVVVEGEPELQQQAALEHPGRDARVADRAEQDRVVLADLLQLGVRQRLAGGVPALRAEVVLGPLERHAVLCGDRVEHLERLGGHLGSDPVTGDDGQREVLVVAHFLGSPPLSRRFMASWTALASDRCAGRARTATAGRLPFPGVDRGPVGWIHVVHAAPPETGCGRQGATEFTLTSDYFTTMRAACPGM